MRTPRQTKKNIKRLRELRSQDPETYAAGEKAAQLHFTLRSKESGRIPESVPADKMIALTAFYWKPLMPDTTLTNERLHTFILAFGWRFETLMGEAHGARMPDL